MDNIVFLLREVGERFRKKRMNLFISLIDKIPKPIKILDVGGAENFWQKTPLINNNNYEIFCLNLRIKESQSSNIKCVVGDATDMREYADKEFDIVFSNAVIEHVGEFKEQQKMAKEIKRLGKRYFLQTPNYYFPLEPHVYFPFFQFFPIKTKYFLMKYLGAGKHLFFRRKYNEIVARKNIDFTRLLKKNELKQLFPGAKIIEEKFLGLTKSFIVYKGF